MCSISTNDKPNKKRKTDHLEQNENQHFTSSETQTSSVTETSNDTTNRKNKKQMTCLPPTSDSLSNLLVQGLQSSDDKLINDVVNKKESVIESTINNLPNVYVEPLFNFLQKSLYEQGENVNYVICLRKLFQCKISQILNIPNIRNNLKMLSDTLDLRCDLLDRCYKLKGRLDLMFLMLNKDDKPLKEENIVIYEESSSEAEQTSDNEDDLIGMMQSDDEQYDDDLNDDLLDEDDQFDDKNINGDLKKDDINNNSNSEEQSNEEMEDDE